MDSQNISEQSHSLKTGVMNLIKHKSTIVPTPGQLIKIDGVVVCAAKITDKQTFWEVQWVEA